MSKPESYTSVWDALADTPGQAANLRARAELMQQIAALVKRQSWTQVEAASHCGVTQPRINDLLRGRVSRFSLDALVTLRRPLAAGSASIWTLRERAWPARRAQCKPACQLVSTLMRLSRPVTGVERSTMKRSPLPMGSQ